MSRFRDISVLKINTFREYSHVNPSSPHDVSMILAISPQLKLHTLHLALGTGYDTVDLSELFSTIIFAGLRELRIGSVSCEMQALHTFLRHHARLDILDLLLCGTNFQFLEAVAHVFADESQSLPLLPNLRAFRTPTCVHDYDWIIAALRAAPLLEEIWNFPHTSAEYLREALEAHARTLRRIVFAPWAYEYDQERFLAKARARLEPVVPGVQMATLKQLRRGDA